jgi:hypothetical protein
MPATTNSRPARLFSFDALGIALLLAAWSSLAVLFIYGRGWVLYYGDSEAHLNIARRIFDSRTPGYDQIGTVWLPLLHVLLLPFAANDTLWRTGVAAAIPSAASFVAGGAFLYSTVRLLWDSRAAALASVGLFALNPNLLYLQSTAMTEPLFYAALMALLYFTVRFRQSQSFGALAGTGLAALAATMTRYDGWFLAPFAAGFICLSARENRLGKTAFVAALAGIGPLYWLAHNWWYFGDALAFYRGPYSALAIQGAADYPGRAEWGEAWLYFGTAARLCMGTEVMWLGALGTMVVLWRKSFWPLMLLALPGVFYVWSI